MKGIVLAGGRSSRFGENKALAKFGGMTFIERSIHLLRDLGLAVTVIHAKEQDYSFLSCPMVADLLSEKGPLGGLYTACRLFDKESLLVLTCDMPTLNRSTLKFLKDSHEQKNQATVLSNQNFLEPFPGIYESSLCDLILEKCDKRQFSMQEFLSDLPSAKIIPWPHPEVFSNVNRKQDLQVLYPN